MKKQIRLTESDLVRLVKRVIKEEMDGSSFDIEVIRQSLDSLKTSYASFINATDDALIKIKYKPNASSEQIKKYIEKKVQPKLEDLKAKIATLETSANLK